MSALDFIGELARRGVTVRGLAIDSRRVQPGDVFLAWPGAQVDGRDFIAQAVARGAVAVIAEPGSPATRVGAGDTPLLEVEGLARHAGLIAHFVYGRPSERLWLAGVTGTNGKTSVSQWIAQAMNALGRKCAVIGTLGNGIPVRDAQGGVDVGALAQSPNTTPDAVTLHRELAGFVAAGAAACVMEVSSIGLAQDRVAGAEFDVAVFTNLTRDHLDYHGTMAAYAAAKDLLFERPGLGAAVINIDDPHGAALATRLAGRVPVWAYTLGAAPDAAAAVAAAVAAMTAADHVLRAEQLTMTAAGLSFVLRVGADTARIEAPLVGRFNAANLLAVIGALLARGEALAEIAAALRHLQAPPGRMQVLGGAHEPLVVVDYAHTPDALAQALGVLRETAAARGGRLLCLFGCGGERDPGKRPQMGAVAERLADAVLLTSDNPRGESPAAIVAEIVAGMQRAPAVELDRARAIRRLVADADARDSVLLAGKGHEPYQEIAGVKQPFSDVDIAQSALAQRRGE